VYEVESQINGASQTDSAPCWRNDVLVVGRWINS
jgi:hypothetical protein